jgi:hypothetical protein
LGNAVRTIGHLVDGAVQLGVNGTITSMVVRPASGIAALPALALGGTEAYTAIQQDLQQQWSPESNNPGAVAIRQCMGQILAPVGQTLQQVRDVSERTGFTAAQAALEVGGLLGGVAAIPAGRAALGNLGSDIRVGFNVLTDAMPVGSGDAARGRLASQVGAVGDLEGRGRGVRMEGVSSDPVFNSAGKVRAEKFADFQQGVSLRDTVALVAGEKPIVTYTTSGKTLYKNPATGKQVVYDNAGNYFRVEDTTITGPLRYTDQFGKPIPNNVVIVREGGYSQTGIPSDIRRALTHFSNTD